MTWRPYERKRSLCRQPKICVGCRFGPIFKLRCRIRDPAGPRCTLTSPRRVLIRKRSPNIDPKRHPRQSTSIGSPIHLTYSYIISPKETELCSTATADIPLTIPKNDLRALTMSLGNRKGGAPTRSTRKLQTGGDHSQQLSLVASRGLQLKVGTKAQRVRSRQASTGRPGGRRIRRKFPTASPKCQTTKNVGMSTPWRPLGRMFWESPCDRKGTGPRSSAQHRTHTCRTFECEAGEQGAPFRV